MQNCSLRHKQIQLLTQVNGVVKAEKILWKSYELFCHAMLALGKMIYGKIINIV